MAMALIIRGDLLYPQLGAHKHPGTGHCIWSLFYVDFLHHYVYLLTCRYNAW